MTGRSRMFKALPAGLAGLALLVLAGPAVATNRPLSFENVTLAQGIEQVRNLAPGRATKHYRFKDGMLSVRWVDKGGGVSVTTYTFRRPGMSLSEAQQVVRTLAIDPIDFKHPHRKGRTLHYDSFMSQATATVLAGADLELVGDKVDTVSLHQEFDGPE